MNSVGGSLRRFPEMDPDIKCNVPNDESWDETPVANNTNPFNEPVLEAMNHKHYVINSVRG